MARLYMYDVRGIQDYVFRTNKIIEIIGASYLVNDLILNLFLEETCGRNMNVVKDTSPDKELKFEFNQDNDIDAEVLYYGGGNLLVLFKDEKQAEEVSRSMCVKLTKKTYSLQLAVSSVEVTGKDNYIKDYKKLREAMEEVKANMPTSLPIQGFPITMQDPITKFPLSKKMDGNKLTYEAYMKRVKFEESAKKKDKNIKINEFQSEEGDSLIAIVHIDGNNMGQHIQKQMQGVKSYKQATIASRAISREIEEVFVGKCLYEVENKVEEICNRVGLENRKSKQAFRKIISAGDDITFVCNARIALYCVKTFLDILEKEGGKYHACAGVFITHSHFPFSKGYEFAEQLCESAKKKNREYMRKDKSLDMSKDSSFIDFHLNFSGLINDIDYIRDQFLKSHTGKKVYARPYHVGTSLNDENIHELDDLLAVLDEISVVPRGKLKNLREAFYIDEQKVETQLDLINSRLNKTIEIKDKTLLYDAIDIMDLKWGEYDETDTTQ